MPETSIMFNRNEFKKIKEGMYVKVQNRIGNILNDRGYIVRGNPIGKIVKEFKYSNSEFKYKVRIADRVHVYCKKEDLLAIN